MESLRSLSTSTSTSNARTIRFDSSCVRGVSPSSCVQIRKRLTPESRASLLCEIPNWFRAAFKRLTTTVVAARFPTVVSRSVAGVSRDTRETIQGDRRALDPTLLRAPDDCL